MVPKCSGTGLSPRAEVTCGKRSTKLVKSVMTRELSYNEPADSARP